MSTDLGPVQYEGNEPYVAALYLRAAGPFARLFSPLANRLLYYGGPTRIPAEQTDLELEVDGVALRGWERNPGRARALLYYGGNSEGLDWLVEPLAQALPGHSCYLLAYRGFGASEGSPSERVLTTDALAVYEYVAKRHRSVDLVGHSLGSAVAIQVAARRPVRRLVLITPFDSIAALAAEHYPWLPVRLLLRDRWDCAAIAHRITAPTLVVRAGRDRVVFPAATDRLLAALPLEPRVLNYSYRNHNSILDAPSFWPEITRFLTH